jgi:hypothetical protein
MTRNSDLDFDNEQCKHKPVTPVCDDWGIEILYWLCACGRIVKSSQSGLKKQDKSG